MKSIEKSPQNLAALRTFLWRRHPDLNRGIRVLQTLALPLGYVAILGIRSKRTLLLTPFCGAGDGARTRYLHLGKVALYQMSYARINVQPSTE